MAINFTDFSKAPLLDEAGKNIFEDVLKGYQMAQAPAQMREEQNARQLANKFRQMEIEHKPKEWDLDDKQKELVNSMKQKALDTYDAKQDLERRKIESIIEKNNRPGGSALKANGDVANRLVIEDLKKDPNANPELIKDLETIVKNKQEHTQAVTDKTRDAIVGKSFDNSPVNNKKQVIGLLQGMGVDPVEAVTLARKGVSPTQYAKEHGINLNEIVPQYPPNDFTIRTAQTASSYLDEIDKLDEHITDGLGKYQNKILGYSFEQIADAAKGDDPNTQGKVLAARALLPELNALRLKIAGANIGIEAIKELENKSLGKLNIFESLVDPKAYASAQKYMKDWINEAGRTRVNSLLKFGMLQSKKNKSNQSIETKEKNEPEILNSANGFTMIRNGTNTFKIPDHLVDKYILDHTGSGFDE